MFSVAQVMSTKEVEDSWKQLALEMVVTIAENGGRILVVCLFVGLLFCLPLFFSSCNDEKTPDISAKNR